MKLTPSEQLAAHLAEQNVNEPAGGFEVFDSEYLAAKEEIHRGHSNDSPDEPKDRIEYFLIWKHYGAPQNGNQSGSGLALTQSLGILTQEVRMYRRGFGMPGCSWIGTSLDENGTPIEEILGWYDSLGLGNWAFGNEVNARREYEAYHEAKQRVMESLEGQQVAATKGER